MAAFTVPPGTPLRVDVFLAHQVPQWSRRVAQRAIADGSVCIYPLALSANPRRARKGDFVGAGDTVEVADAALVVQELQANPQLQLPIVYEDDALLVVDKPAGLPSVALRADELNSVANFIVFRSPQAVHAGASPLEAGLVHRLDTNTSGLVLAAKTPAAYQDLRRQFSEQSVGKEYVAVVHGVVESAGVLRLPIAHSRRRDRMQVAEEGARGRPAVTAYEPVACGHLAPLSLASPTSSAPAAPVSLLRVRIASGVMHQIRVHLAALGHPVVGDGLYGSSVDLGSGRHLLHASRLTFTHPVRDEAIILERAAPQDFELFVDATP